MSVEDIIDNLPELLGGIYKSAVMKLKESLDCEKDAEPIYVAVVNISSSLERILISAGDLHERLNDKETAKRCYESATELGLQIGDSHIPYIRLSAIYTEEGDLDAAQKILEKGVITNNIDSVELNVRLGDVYMESGRLDDAEAQYRKAVDRSPSYTIGWQKLGEVYVKKGEHKRAISCFRRAIKFLERYGKLSEDFNDRLAAMNLSMAQSYANAGNERAARKYFGMYGVLTHQGQG